MAHGQITAPGMSNRTPGLRTELLQAPMQLQGFGVGERVGVLDQAPVDDVWGHQLTFGRPRKSSVRISDSVSQLLFS